MKFEAPKSSNPPTEKETADTQDIEESLKNLGQTIYKKRNRDRSLGYKYMKAAEVNAQRQEALVSEESEDEDNHQAPVVHYGDPHLSIKKDIEDLERLEAQIADAEQVALERHDEAIPEDDR